ncbi:tail fiber domain-containing protein [Archangium primigenium]|uniref:tail fiber domain-containing protein n=1 Tax=[Archangium] primigenium TaxID=2792470 RepID=UPI00195B0176|nr:tail fiber domain-containing protein [Archangium primigenium]MBM7117713.1 tail fiber domain-containing protein [Archangium primigenium]
MSIRGAVVAWSGVAIVGLCGCDPATPPPSGVQVGTGLSLDGEAVRVVYGDGPGTSVEGNDARLAQALQKGTTPQDASFAVRGTGQVQGRLTANTDVVLDATASAQEPVPLLSVRNTTDKPAWAGFPLFSVDSAGGLVAAGELGNGTLPVTGKGYRLMWYPSKASFRAGYTETQWDEANIGFLSWAGGNLTKASALGSFAYGDQCEAEGTVAVCLGSVSKASGTASLSVGASNVASGFTSVALGYTNVASGQGSVALGYRVSANANYSFALGHRADSGGHSGAFIWGDQSTTSTVTNTAANQFMVRAAGGVRLRTSATLSTGCDLPAGSGVFSCTSDRDSKEDFRSVDGEQVLARVLALPVRSWQYKSEQRGVRHVGPVAQDFRAAFGLGPDERSIGLLDIDGVNMVAIQALARRTEELKAKSAEVDALKTEMSELKRSLARLEAAVLAKP